MYNSNIPFPSYSNLRGSKTIQGFPVLVYDVSSPHESKLIINFLVFLSLELYNIWIEFLQDLIYLEFVSC